MTNDAQIFIDPVKVVFIDYSDWQQLSSEDLGFYMHGSLHRWALASHYTCVTKSGLGNS